ncbi:transcription termination/antitermination protein NusA [Puniceicoccales bacterium CK1056]|uniref:Transcription termination/antitermination protein NusA n=1 Tax=Oceanipulchritudo coccoides TaxID=2706888 RepID=A0A6B2LZ00_9BACT|nr:transcription termination factor NusA [Oceanipulchritudo coccoides]NDV61164.1 transcription termination/antitermination protein NusA [Oceanipulchritudo coccoides]
MSQEILSVLEFMEKEKGIPREDMISAISNAIRSAATKGVNAGQELRIEINPKSGALKAWSILEVVDSVGDPRTQIHIEKARQLNPEAEVGLFIEKEVDPERLGRIAAQTARQTIMQRLRQFEKERIYDDYKDNVGDIVTGIVRRRERGDLIVDLGKAEAMLPPRERVPGEDYSPGERMRCLLLAIEPTNRGPELILSRAAVRFVRRLFELEVAEIQDGTVIIEAIAREPGYRTKIAVSSKDPKVDPVGACVGARGARVKSIVRELGGEKIDIVKFSSDPLELLHEAIKPAVPLNIKVDELNKRIYFEVSEDNLSIAIGRRGQNARLTSRLLGWKLDISKEEVTEVGFDERMKNAIKGWEGVQGISDELAAFLVQHGLVSPEAFEGVEAKDLVKLGFSEEDAGQVVKLVDAHRSASSSEAG